MNLSQIVISIDNAKKLKELGVEIDGYAYWHHFDHEDKDGNYVGKGNGISQWVLVAGQRYKGDEGVLHVPAHTASELMELLPDDIEHKEDGYAFFKIYKNVEYGYTAGYYSCYGELQSIGNTNKSLPDALALLLIHLIEQGLWKPEN